MSVVSVGFALALAPQVARCARSGAGQISPWAAWPTAAGCVVMAATLFTLDCRLTAATTAATGLEWAALGLMALRARRTDSTTATRQTPLGQQGA